MTRSYAQLYFSLIISSKTFKQQSINHKSDNRRYEVDCVQQVVIMLIIIETLEICVSDVIQWALYTLKNTGLFMVGSNMENPTVGLNFFIKLDLDFPIFRVKTMEV